MLRHRIGQLRRQVLCSVHARPLLLKNPTPVVSFCFDDFPRTAYTAGGSILKSFAARGTYYAALGLMNTTNELGDQLRSGDIDSVLADGHELGCHTFSHLSGRRVSLSVFEKDVLKGRDAIRRITGRNADHFAYPYGHVTLRSKKRLGRLLCSSRGIYSGINGPVADLGLLRANSLYGDLDRLAAAESLLAENRTAGGWLIFYTHDVRRDPSPFGCTPALLDRVVSLSRELGFHIAPVGEVVAQAREAVPAPVVSLA